MDYTLICIIAIIGMFVLGVIVCLCLFKYKVDVKTKINTDLISEKIDAEVSVDLYENKKE